MTKSDGDDSSSKEMWLKLHVLAEVASMFYDELQRTKKGKSKIVYEQDDQEDQVVRLNKVLDSVPRKARSKTLRLNGASTSSSLSPLHLNNTQNPPPSEPSMEMQNPRNPSPNSQPSSSRLFLTHMKYPNFQSSKSRKRRAVKDNRKSKKAKIVHLSWKGRGIPESLLQIMRNTNVLEEPKLIFERTLFKTDVNPTQSRLSMPISQVMFKDFLTPVEVKILEQDINNEVKVGVKAFLVNQRSQMWRAVLKRWESTTSWNYSVTFGWNDFVAANGLEEDHGISVWTFRWRGILCFAVIPPPER